MTRQEEIKHLLNTLGIRPVIVAEKLGMKANTFNYLIEESPQIEEDFYFQIKKIIDDYQFELHLFDADQSESLDLFDDEKFQIGIGERMRLFAQRKYGTLKNLAEAMKISPQQLQQYISGKREPGSKILAKLLRLGCDINWILGGRESWESYKIYRLEGEVKKYQTGMQQIETLIHKIENKVTP
ncbi:MAG: helix-turn-helix transcriptional regulator [Melioribacteraceae bacterium]